MKKRIIVCIFVAFAVFLFLYQTGYTQGEVIDFTLKDIKGKDVTLGNFIGKNVILLVFSATWCPPCNKEIPELKKLHNEYGESGLKIIDVYIQESRRKLVNFVKNKDIPYTILLDLDGGVARQYKVRGIPTLMVIDKKGIIQKRSYPPSSRFIPLFEELLKE